MVRGTIERSGKPPKIDIASGLLLHRGWCCLVVFMFCSSTDFFPSLRGALYTGHWARGDSVGYNPSTYVVSGDSRTLRGHQSRGYLGLVPDTCSGGLGKDAHAYQYLASAISGAAPVPCAGASAAWCTRAETGSPRLVQPQHQPQGRVFVSMHESLWLILSRDGALAGQWCGYQNRKLARGTRSWLSTRWPSTRMRSWHFTPGSSLCAMLRLVQLMISNHVLNAV